MAKDTVPADVFALLDDEYARGILRATNGKPMPARQLAEELDASRSTVYQRIEQLQAVDLLIESTDLSPNGHHRSVYEAQLDRIVVELTEDDFEVTVTRRDHPADRFTDIWENL
ncbi:ArsR/SmtB family transcription factor [Halobellus salinisoli]|uniref:ArsR/SmtB family transcription factor n=1 Tax=Halobellus salinisoli TaxID=3108500 RepID=UPI00300BEAD0